MRICLIASSRFPVAEPFAGGLEAHNAALARGLIERGHTVCVFAAPGSDPRLNVDELEVLAMDMGACFVLASTSEVYGDPQVYPRPEGY